MGIFLKNLTFFLIFLIILIAFFIKHWLAVAFFSAYACFLLVLDFFQKKNDE